MLYAMIGRIVIYTVLAGAGVSVLLLAVNVSDRFFGANVAAPLYSTPVGVSAKSWLIFDVESGAIYGAHNADVELPIASVTKLFSAYVVYNTDALDEDVTVIGSDVATEGHAGKLRAGDVLTRRELTYPLLLESSNDAGTALMRTITADAYDSAIANVTDQLYMPQTVILDATGLSAGNISTARELARFLTHISEHERQLLAVTRLRAYLNGTHGWINNNPARESIHFLGGKHGYTDEAEFTFIGLYEAHENGHPVGVVLLGSKDLRTDLAAVERALTHRSF